MEYPDIILVKIIKNSGLEYKYKNYYVFKKPFIDSEDIQSLWIVKPQDDDGLNSYIYLRDTNYNKVIRKMKLDQLNEY